MTEQELINTPTMYPIRGDKRYSIRPEYTGEQGPRWVLRFCGDWVSSHLTRGGAVTRAVGERARAQGALTVMGLEQ